MELGRLIQEYESLLDKALTVISGAPYWHSYAELTYARLEFDGENATLRYPKAAMEYDWCGLETEQVTFPASLLLLSDAELDSWKKEQDILYQKQERERRASEATKKEADEKALLARLQAKYPRNTPS